MTRVQVLSVVWLVVVGSGQLDAQTSLQVTVDQLAADVAHMKAQIATLEGRTHGVVAFTAWVADHEGPTVLTHQGGVVPFHNVLTNIGGGYNPTTSTFTAPVDGVYFFAVSVDVTADYSNGLHVMLNGSKMVLNADKDDNISDHVTAAGLVHLAAGDKVTCAHAATHGGVDTGIESTFSGFLVK